MLALPVRPGLLCLAKFLVLVLLSFIQIAAMTGLYFLCARIASAYVDYDLMVQAEQVLRAVPEPFSCPPCPRWRCTG